MLGEIGEVLKQLVDGNLSSIDGFKLCLVGFYGFVMWEDGVINSEGFLHTFVKCGSIVRPEVFFKCAIFQSQVPSTLEQDQKKYPQCIVGIPFSFVREPQFRI